MELEFRDGPRWVPDHVAAMLVGIDTHRITYEEAVNIANRRMVSDRLNKIQHDVTTEHFKNWGK